MNIVYIVFVFFFFLSPLHQWQPIEPYGKKLRFCKQLTVPTLPRANCESSNQTSSTTNSHSFTYIFFCHKNFPAILNKVNQNILFRTCPTDLHGIWYASTGAYKRFLIGQSILVCGREFLIKTLIVHFTT